jgi:hypothetical protein
MQIITIEILQCTPQVHPHELLVPLEYMAVHGFESVPIICSRYAQARLDVLSRSAVPTAGVLEAVEIA